MSNVSNQSHRHRPSKAVLVWIAAATIAALLILAAWPGRMIGDNVQQLQEIRTGHISDWHSPFIGLLWRALGATPGPMMVLQVLLYWSGFALLADEMRRRSGIKAAAAMLAVGLTPLSVLYVTTTQKDTLMVALLVLASGLVARFGRRKGIAVAALAALTRLNALFAFPPFVVRRRGWALYLASCILLAALLIPVIRLINLEVLGAERSHVEKSLQLFDIAGIEKYSGRHDLGPDLGRCYSPFYWDPLIRHCDAFNRSPDDLTGTWLSAMVKEPVAYAEHRLMYFNSATFFLVPPRQECVLADDPVCPTESKSLLRDALARNMFFWPVTWLLVGVLMLVCGVTEFSEMLVVSALLYGFTLLALGVASGFRYFYWTELAIQIALVWEGLTAGLPYWRRILVPVVLLWLVCFAYRYAPLLT